MVASSRWRRNHVSMRAVLPVPPGAMIWTKLVRGWTRLVRGGELGVASDQEGVDGGERAEEKARAGGLGAGAGEGDLLGDALGADGVEEELAAGGLGLVDEIDEDEVFDQARNLARGDTDGDEQAGFPEWVIDDGVVEFF